MNRDQYWLTEPQFARIAPHLPTDTRGKPRVDDRRVISGIVHVLKSGGRWIDAPPDYGPRKTLYNRFVCWAAKGVWTDLFHALACAGGPPAQILILTFRLPMLPRIRSSPKPLRLIADHAAGEDCDNPP
ncbi:putative transposase [Bosea sp. LC85]|nr:putative transposase [Bosea sp. LC85]